MSQRSVRLRHAWLAAAVPACLLGVAGDDSSAPVRAGAAATADDARSPIPEPSVNARTGVRWYRDIAYVSGDDGAEVHPKQVLDLYLPEDESWMEGRPLLVWIHGGGWIIGDKDDGAGIYGRYCRKLAERGIAAANVSYRLSPEVRHPAHIQDIAAAIAWLEDHAEEFSFDPTRMFVSGHSAGGHLAALVSVDPRWLEEAGADPENIIGAIPSSGVYDLRPMFEGRYAFGGAFPQDSIEDASPVTHVDEGDPPFLLMIEAYGMYMRSQTSAMADALDTAGVSHTIAEVPQSNHISMLFELASDEGVALTQSVAFIERVLQEEAPGLSADDAAEPAEGGG